jgi:hypothetical protein
MGCNQTTHQQKIFLKKSLGQKEKLKTAKTNCLKKSISRFQPKFKKEKPNFSTWFQVGKAKYIDRCVLKTYFHVQLVAKFG